MNSNNGIVTHPGSYPVSETLDRLEALLHAKGITVFARINHSGDAEKAGLKMPPTQVPIFGDPKAGTPIMPAAPLAAIDLPLKALAWQDAAGIVRLSYNDPTYLEVRFEIGRAHV